MWSFTCILETEVTAASELGHVAVDDSCKA